MDKFDWECWNHYGIEQKFRKIGNKLDEIIEKYNEIMRWREKHCTVMQCGQCEKIIKRTTCFKDDKPVCRDCWYK